MKVSPRLLFVLKSSQETSAGTSRYAVMNTYACGASNIIEEEKSNRLSEAPIDAVSLAVLRGPNPRLKRFFSLCFDRDWAVANNR